ncbi:MULTISPECIES: hypothetical protein [unclassified Lysinibacillus]
MIAEVQSRVYAMNYRIKEYKQKIVEVQKTHYLRDWGCDVVTARW